MNIYIDTEFQEYAPDKYTLISLGACADTGETFYAEADWWDPQDASIWLQRNVCPTLIGGEARLTRAQFNTAFRHWVFDVAGNKPSFWGYYSTHDWFLICDLLGGFMMLPEGWPQWCNDIQTLRTLNGTLHARPPHNTNEHNALADALWTKQMYDHFSTMKTAPAGSLFGVK